MSLLHLEKQKYKKKKKKEKEHFLLTEHTWTKEDELSLAKARSMLTLLFR